MSSSHAVKKPRPQVSLRDRLSHLSFEQAARLLGPEGKRLLMRGGQLELPMPSDLHIGDDEAWIRWESRANGLTSRIVLDPASRDHFRAECNRCSGPCVHVGGLLALLLESKSDLGLAIPPPLGAAADDEETLIAQALQEREERSKKERMKIVSADRSTPWTDYVVTNTQSGKSYRVALRGLERGVSYCSCPDFRINTLGTCKHVMRVLGRTSKRFSKTDLAKPYRRRRVTVHLDYRAEPWFAIAMPHAPSPKVTEIMAPLVRGPIIVDVLMRALHKLEAEQHAFFVTPDAEELLQRELTRARLHELTSEIRRAPQKHPLRMTLLKEPLLPYQLDGIAFAAGAGRAIVADEMGLGKTIQGVGVAELLAREIGIERVLVVCPASLKAQWRAEIERFCGRSVQLVTGPARDRARTYANDTFFTVCNYEQVLKDILHIEKARWDLIILDEGQRIKNWEAKTSRVIKGLASRFALVLSGTPLENRLEDLHSVVAFVDPHKLGPSFKFLHRHQRRDADGKVVGFKNLDELRDRLRPILLRRTRASVRLELPARTTEIVRIVPTAEQLELHDAHMRTVAQIVSKPYFTEMDLLRLRVALLMCRMSANSTFLVDKQAPGFSTKLERLGELFDSVCDEPDRKVVLFSEWTTMLDLIEPLLSKRKLGYVRLDGAVPQRKRQEIVAQFQSDPKTRLFLTTNAGSTGLNLQAANTIINVDLPWNPAVLEQRIARAHRMGQTRPVSVFVLVTEGTIEENLLTTLATKRDLAIAALDPDAEVTSVDVRTHADDIKAKLEILIGQRPPASVDETVKEATATQLSNDRIAQAGSTLLRSAFDLLAELSGERNAAIHKELSEAVDVKVVDEGGKRRLSIGLPSTDVVTTLLQGLSSLLARLRPSSADDSSPPRADATTFN